MAIIKKNQDDRRVLDLTGPEGNAYVLLGVCGGIAKQLGMDWKTILKI